LNAAEVLPDEVLENNFDNSYFKSAFIKGRNKKTGTETGTIHVFGTKKSPVNLH